MKLLPFIFLAIIFSSGCKKSGCSETTDCVQAAIKQFKSSSTACSHGASIKEYTFQGKKVYVYTDGNCIADGGSTVTDANCNYLGFLGGIGGMTKINGEDFSSAVYQRTLWSN